MATATRTRDPWLVAAGGILTLGLAIELHSQSLVWSLGVLGALALLGVAMAAAVGRDYPELRRTFLFLAPGISCAMMGLDGIVRVSPWSPLVVLALLVASPRVRSGAKKAGRWLVEDAKTPSDPSAWTTPAPARATPPTGSAPARPRLALPAPETLDVPGLRRAWSLSYVALQMAEGPQERWRIAQVRRSYLDRLEMLDPKAFDAWLTKSADPARAYRGR